MSELPHTFEDVFSQEYWDPIPPQSEINPIFSTRYAKAYRGPGKVSQRIDKDTRVQVDDALFVAGSQLLAGEPTQRIDEGEQIGGAEDSLYGIPGAVLLIDREELRLKRHEIVYPLKRQMQEAELGRAAVSSFLSGRTATKFGQYSKKAPGSLDNLFKPLNKLVNITDLDYDSHEILKEDYALINPYDKAHAEENHGLYERSVDLFAFYHNKKGQIANLRLWQWRNPPDHQWIIAPATGENFWPYGAVGETKNISYDAKTPRYTRIREAHICLRGSLAYAKARQKQRQGLFAKRLVALPSAD